MVFDLAKQAHPRCTSAAQLALELVWGAKIRCALREIEKSAICRSDANLAPHRLDPGVERARRKNLAPDDGGNANSERWVAPDFEPGLATAAVPDHAVTLFPRPAGSGFKSAVASGRPELAPTPPLHPHA